MAKREVAFISSFCCLYRKENSNMFRYFVAVFNKTVISFALVGYEMINSQRGAIYHLTSNARSWNNC